MRICSLVPGATEVVVTLGLGEALVGISHECDFPASIRHIPVMVQPVVDSDGADSAEIDRQVKTLMSSGRSLYRVDEQALAKARPDIIVTQDVCDVCAVTPHALARAVQSLSPRPQLITLAPRSLEEVIEDVERIGVFVPGGMAELDRMAILLRHNPEKVVKTLRVKAEAGRQLPENRAALFFEQPGPIEKHFDGSALHIQFLHLRDEGGSLSRQRQSLPATVRASVSPCSAAAGGRRWR